MIRHIPKIDSIFKRDHHGRFTAEYSRPEFARLADIPWYWTYKWDGTSSGVFYGDNTPTVFGKSSRTAWQPGQEAALARWALDNARFDGSGLTVYGEVVGPGFQSNHHGLHDVQFKPFAVRNAQGTWWESDRVHGEIPDAPNPSPYRLSAVAGMSRDELDAFIGAQLSPHTQRYVEGMVGTPDLRDLGGNRIWTKIKLRDLA